MNIYVIIVLATIAFLFILEIAGFVPENPIEKFVAKKFLVEKFEDKIFRNRPRGYNTSKSSNFIDNSPQDIIRNYRRPLDYSKITNEMDYYQMNQVVESLKTDVVYFEFNDKMYKLDELQFSLIPKEKWSQDQYYQYILSKIKYNFVLQFNINSRKFKHDDPHYPVDLFRVINTEIIRWFYNEELEYFKIILNIEMYRPNKTNSFILYSEIGFKPTNDAFIIYDSKIIGTRNQDQIAFNTLYNNGKLEGGVTKTTELPVKPDDYSDYVLDIEDPVQSFTEIENQRAEDNAQRKEEEMYKCFHPSVEGQFYEGSKDKNDCESYHENLGSVAIWDRPCLKDDECPFYQANKNYPNNRGGCVKDPESGTGFCELPVGMNLIGYRRYGKDLPYCYNCGENKGENCSGVECSRCCDKQRIKVETDGSGESKMKSPDFIFKDDKNERLQHREELLKRGLSPLGLLD